MGLQIRKITWCPCVLRYIVALIIFMLLICSVLVPYGARADDPGKWYSPYTQTLVDKDGHNLEVDSTPMKPPAVKMAAANLPGPGTPGTTATLTNVPAFNWVYGCYATSAGMLAGYYDQLAQGYTNMYAGPANGGVCPMNNETYWGNTVYTGVTCGECPLVATHLGKDGLATKAHVDDYWDDVNSTVDPYWGAWTQHAYADCTADYMGTNQYHNWFNKDGSTWLYNNGDNSPTYDYTGGETASPPWRDGCHGMRLFIESRGYTVTSNYNQRISGYGGLPEGFTYDNFKAQINAGRPVFIQVVGHSMLGYGYSDPDTIAIHDTWDHLDHTMTWGGVYSGMQHTGVTVIELAALPTPAPAPAPTPVNPLIGTGAPTSHGAGAGSTSTTTTQTVSITNIQTQSASLSAKTVTPGTPITVTADIANKSAVNGSKKVTLYVNGQVETTQGITVNSGGSTQLTFNVSRSEPGDYSVYVDGVPAGSFKVELFRESDGILIVSAALVAMAFLLGMVMLWRRQRAV